MKKTISFGKIDFSRNGRKAYPAEVEIELRDTEKGVEFSACGNIWNTRRTDIVMGGQCLSDMNKFLGNNPNFANVYRLWKLYHLNGMHPECEHQRELGWRKQAREIIPCGDMRGWTRFDKDERGILCKPCPVCGYKYGTALNYMSIPEGDLQEIKKLFEDN